jgi:hypothetical protein
MKRPGGHSITVLWLDKVKLFLVNSRKRSSERSTSNRGTAFGDTEDGRCKRRDNEFKYRKDDIREEINKLSNTKISIKGPYWLQCYTASGVTSTVGSHQSQGSLKVCLQSPFSTSICLDTIHEISTPFLLKYRV